MENCIYQGEIICTFDLKDDNGLYYEDLVLDWKESASERRLTCVECGAPVYLAAGPIKEPYFAHYDIDNCDYSNSKESEELKKGKRLLYHLLKRSFPECNIQAGYHLENGMYSTLFCADSENSLAIDYRLLNNSLQKFRIRDNFYQANHFTSVYIMSKRQEKDAKQIDWYQNLLQNAMGYLAFLDVKQESLTLKKSFSYRLGEERHFSYCIKTYPIRELSIDFKGQMLCDFSVECNKVEQQIEQEKLRYQKSQDQLRELREEKLRLEKKEQERMEAYRRRTSLDHLSSGAVSLVPDKIYRTLNDQQIIELGLNPALFAKCVKLIEIGDGYLVAKKYYDVIMGI